MIRGVRAAALAGLLTSIACAAALHVLRPDLSPVRNRLSEYAVGPYGWVMTAVFVSLGVGLVAMGVAYRARGADGALGGALPVVAVLAGAGMAVSGVFPTGASHASEVIHSRASALSTVGIVGLAVLRWLQERRADRGGVDRPGAALAVASAVLAALSPILHDTRLTGANQRVLWVVLLAWLLRAAWRLPKRRF